MSVKMSDVFALPVQQGEHGRFLLSNDDALIAEFEEFRESEVEYSVVAINSYEGSQELIASQAETIAKQQEKIDDLDEMISQRGIDNTMLRVKAKKQQADIELLRERAIKLTSAIAKHSCRDDRDDLCVDIDYIECECDDLEQALAATKGEEG